MSVLDRVLGRDVPPAGDRLAIRIDELFHLFQNPRRRFVIEYVGSMNADESVSVNDLARAIAFTENDVPDIESVNNPQMKRVYISLHQTHLGKLDDAGLIRWDDQAQTVSPTADTSTAWEIVRRTNAMLTPEAPA